MQEIIQTFTTYLFSEFKDLKACEYDFEHDYDRTILGYKDGEVFEIDKDEIA